MAPDDASGPDAPSEPSADPRAVPAPSGQKLPIGRSAHRKLPPANISANQNRARRCKNPIAAPICMPAERCASWCRLHATETNCRVKRIPAGACPYLRGLPLWSAAATTPLWLRAVRFAAQDAGDSLIVRRGFAASQSAAAGDALHMQPDRTTYTDMHPIPAPHSRWHEIAFTIGVFAPDAPGDGSGAHPRI